MSKAAANEVVATEHGLIVVGNKGAGARVWFLPKNKAKASERLNEFSLLYAPPRASPAALLPSGKLLVVGHNGESLTLEPGRSAQPGPVIGNTAIDGLSGAGIAFAKGPKFYRFAGHAWADESPVDQDALRSVRALDGDLAVGKDGDAWLGPTWKKVKLKTKAHLNCISGRWVGGDDVVLERTGKTFKVHGVKGSVTAIAGWEKGVLLLVGGAVVDLKGKAIKAPPGVSSLSAHGGTAWCVSRGGLFQSTDLKRWTRKALAAH